MTRQKPDRRSKKSKELPQGPKPSSRESLLIAMDEMIEAKLVATPRLILDAAKRMLRAPDLLDQIERDLTALGVVGERENKLLLYLTSTSRLLQEALYASVQGSSSSGKSHLIKTVLKAMPPESTKNMHGRTKRALENMPPGALMHRVINLGERSLKDESEVAQGNQMLRELHSGDAYTRSTSTKNSNSNWSTQDRVHEGPLAVMETTTKTRLHDEDANRYLALRTDESEEQTARVNESISNRYSVRPNRTVVDREVHWSLQRMLKRVRVAIPYGRQLSQLMPTDTVESRRATEMVMKLVSAHTLLHQQQRPNLTSPGQPPRHGDTIAANLVDYANIRSLAQHVVAHALGQKRAPAITKFAQTLHARSRNQGHVFTKQDAVSWTDYTPASVANKLTDLRKLGLIEKRKIKPGLNATDREYHFVADPAETANTLPSLEQLSALLDQKRAEERHNLTEPDHEAGEA